MNPSDIATWIKNGHARSAGVRAAVDLGLVEACRHRKLSTATVAETLGITPHSATVLTRFLRAGGLLRRTDPDGEHVTTDLEDEEYGLLAAAAAATRRQWAAVACAPDHLRRGNLAPLPEWSTLTAPPTAPTGLTWALDALSQGHLRTACLTSALDLDILGALNEAPRTVPDLADHVGLPVTTVSFILDGLAAMHIVEDGPPAHRLAAGPATLLATNRSAAGLRSAAALSQHFWAALGALEDVARTGRVSFDLQDRATSARYYRQLARYNSLVFPAYLRLAESVVDELPHTTDAQVLDLGAGSGVWSVAFARRWVDAQMTLADRASVLEQAAVNLTGLGLSRRVSYAELDLATSDFGNQVADVVVLGQICHTQPVGTLPSLLHRCFEALRPGGLLVMADSILQDDGASPAGHLDFALKELVSTGGAIHTDREYRRLLADAGFTNLALTRRGDLDVMTAARPPTVPSIPSTDTAHRLVAAT